MLIFIFLQNSEKHFDEFLKSPWDETEWNLKPRLQKYNCAKYCFLFLSIVSEAISFSSNFNSRIIVEWYKIFRYVSKVTMRRKWMKFKGITTENK